jgi:hypothetical protein
VALDESHPAHVRGQHENLVGTLRRGFAMLAVFQIKLQVFDAGEVLIPTLKGLDTHGSNTGVPLAAEISNQRAANEAVCSRHHD